MKSRNTFGIHFVIRIPKQQKNGMATVYARIAVNGRRSEISLKKKIAPKDWDDTKGKAKGKREEIQKLNSHIERVRTLIADAYHELVQQRKTVSVDAVKSLFLGTAEDTVTLRKLVEYHNRETAHKLAQGTLKNYYTTQSYIKRFLKEKYRRTDIALSELNYSFISDFEYYLRNYKPKDHHRPLNNNGIMKHIERLRKMVNMAVTMDWLVKDPFAKFRKHFDKVERKSLTKQELDKLESKLFRVERLQQVLDMFLFSCYTGLAYIDLAELTPDNIITGIDGDLWIYTSRAKTDTSVRIPLLPKARELMGKYRDDPRAISNGTVFPVISNQRMNGYLKEIAELCEISTDLTFHIARHTFATTVTLSNGVPIESVSKMLGHTSIRTTQIYAKVVEHKLSEDMQNLRERMASGS
ncbi:site-specific integrase [Sphingobacterium mizutaii]|uniref:site-specific integrase n=1 Tax=Sphingobacterium mizutaii TaxID=1010 RepID=UPI0016255AC5|nr:site-specific integrase [Sphingobacterium mizutaii]